MAVPAELRTPEEATAIEQGARLLAAHAVSPDERSAEPPVSPLWLRFGFPLGFTSDLVEWLDVLLEAKGAICERTVAATHCILAKQDGQGRWMLEHTPRNMWAACGRRGSPDKWVTVRALRAIRKAVELGGVS